MGSVTYYVTDWDKKAIQRLSQERDGGKPNTCHNGTVSATESKHRHEVGLKGEIAFANTFGLDLDEKHYPSGDFGYDFALESGLKIDVKTRRKSSGDDLALESNTLEEVIADIFVLAHERPNDIIVLVGWTYPLHFHVYGEVKDLEGPRLLETPDRLLPMGELGTIVNNL